MESRTRAHGWFVLKRSAGRLFRHVGIVSSRVVILSRFEVMLDAVITVQLLYGRKVRVTHTKLTQSAELDDILFVDCLYW